MAVDPIKVELAASSKRTIAKMKGTDLLPALRKGVRKATDEAVPATKGAARNLPSQSGDTASNSLRRQIANAIKRNFHFSAKSVAVTISVVPKGDKSNLAKCVEGIIPWNHPTYGHDPTVTQAPEPFFYKTLNEMLPSMVAKIEATLREYEKML